MADLVNAFRVVSGTDFPAQKERVERLISEKWKALGSYVVREPGKPERIHTVMIIPASGEDGERFRPRPTE